MLNLYVSQCRMMRLRLSVALLAALVAQSGRTAGQTEAGDAETTWWGTTPFASLPGMTTQQVLRTILPPDAVAYSPVASPDEAATVRDYVSAFRTHSRGMEHLHKYTNLFVDLVAPQRLVPPGSVSAVTQSQFTCATSTSVAICQW